MVSGAEDVPSDEVGRAGPGEDHELSFGRVGRESVVGEPTEDVTAARR